MLHIQKLFCNNSIHQALNKLDKLKINHKIEEYNGYKVLHADYTIFSPKDNDLVKECRGIALNVKDWSVSRLGFKRFMNDGETGCEKIQYESKCVCEEKQDGSLILLHYIPELNFWNIGTRGVVFPIKNEYKLPGYNGGFHDLFNSIFELDKINILNKNYTYIFELCSIHNRVVIYHPEPVLYLTGARSNINFHELKDEKLNEIAEKINCFRPHQFFDFFDMTKFSHKRKNDENYLKSKRKSRRNNIHEFVQNLNGGETEGVVVKQWDEKRKEYKRVKIKNKGYCTLHKSLSSRTFNNIVEMVLNKQRKSIESLCGFEELLNIYDYIENEINCFSSEAEKTYQEQKWILFHPNITYENRRKQFARSVMSTPYGKICFLLADDKISKVQKWIYEEFNTSKGVKKLIQLLKLDESRYYESQKEEEGI